MIWIKPYKVKFEVKPTKKSIYYICRLHYKYNIQMICWSWQIDGVVTQSCGDSASLAQRSVLALRMRGAPTHTCRAEPRGSWDPATVTDRMTPWWQCDHRSNFRSKPLPRDSRSNRYPSDTNGIGCTSFRQYQFPPIIGYISARCLPG